MSILTTNLVSAYRYVLACCCGRLNAAAVIRCRRVVHECISSNRPLAHFGSDKCALGQGQKSRPRSHVGCGGGDLVEPCQMGRGSILS
jgi:hypothetical protein